VKTHILIATLLFFVGGCFTPDTVAVKTRALSSATGANSTASKFAPGARAAKFIFKQSSPSGSFDASPAGGTPAAVGSGLAAQRVFNADGSALASGGPTNVNWPKWISNLEIGISGQNNPSALNANCARFANASEELSSCHFDGNGAGPATPCGATAGLFRVSELDCAQQAPVDGNGGPADGVYIRAVFNRDPAVLGTAENIMAVIEYSSSALNGNPANPTSCFLNGNFSPENCADSTWKVFMKHTAAEIVQPYLLLVPPAFGSVNNAKNSGGGSVGTKQFYVPLGADGALSIIQISRIKGIGVSPVFTTTCSNGALPANSPLCSGMVIYSITFFRI
jgi:hypothetical protein